jgi:hypothetical protein
VQSGDGWQVQAAAGVAGVVMSVRDAVERELEEFGAAKSVLGETALALAVELDDGANSATSKSMCAKAMVDVLREIRALKPPKPKADSVTDLSERRAKRRRAAAKASSRS